MGNCCWKSDDDDDNIDRELDYSGSDICVIKNKESLEQIISESIKTNKIVVVNFSAAWCYIESSKKYRYILFLAVDIDELVEIASDYEVGATPAFFFLLSGRTVDTLVGAHKEQFQRKMEILASF